MKLSEIMAFKNLLESMTPLSVAASVSAKLNPILTVVSENPHQIESLTSQLTKEYRDIFRFVGDFECTLEAIKTALQDRIDQNNKSYFDESFKNYTESVDYETNEFILSRKLPIYNEVVGKLVNRIRYYNNWKYVGLIIRPGHEDWIQDLVACDPLYLVDTNDELIEPARLRFNDQYQRRLRTYTVRETTNAGMLYQLPNGQFGFCLIYNFFNYKPIEIIESYLKELYIKMKPGGVIAFTFNNCDRAEGIELFEKHFMSYTPGNNIIKLCQSIGFEIKNIFGLDQSCTWIEIAHPGTLESLRGGQALAKVMDPSEEIRIQQQLIKEIEEKRLSDKKIQTDAKDLNIANWQTLSLDQLRPIVEQHHQIVFENEQKIRYEARDLNISNWETLPMDELKQKLQIAYDFDEMNKLRKKAIRLQLDRTERILNSKHYPLEKLRELINQWRKTQ